MFITNFTPERLAGQISDIKKLSPKHMGGEDAIKFVQLVTTVIGETYEEREEKYKDLRQYGDFEGSPDFI